MKNKIALLGGAKRRRQMEAVLSKCLKSYDIPFEIHHVPNSQNFIHEVLFNNDFRLIMEASKETINYMLKIYTNFDQQYSRHITGTMKYPMTEAELIKNMLKTFKLSNVCPYGVYAAKNAKMSRLITHEDIQFIHKEKNKSVIHMHNGEDIKEVTTQAKVLKQLDASYFFKCHQGYVVNFFNIEEISDDYKFILLKSGDIIPMSRLGFKQLVKAISLSITGSDAFDY